MDSELPSGIVTLVFTDIEGSTDLLREVGPEEYEKALAEHRAHLRAAFDRRGGVELGTEGDSFFYVFASAPEAVEAAREAQLTLSGGPVRVRMGMHTGRPRIGAEGYVGEDVHLAARISAAGHGGQVLVSQATRALVDMDLADLGEHRVKDFPEPVWLFQLGSERFPPLKTISNTNLPSPAASFVGRKREIAEIVGLLQAEARLVTLSGSGGSGKTRLAIEAGAELVPEFRNGVFWVGLAGLRDPALVAETVAQALGAKDDLARHIGDRDLLLLLDNFEHVIDAALELGALLESCPHLRLMVTSRELLRIRGEVDYPVPALEQSEATALFCARSHLPPSKEVAELCRRLDNLPLAIELAAARTSALSPAQILERLSERLDLLRGGRDADPRQLTLRATIEWSHDLLALDEERLFARLSVFAGGCTVEAATDVADADLDTLQSLVEKSLVRHADERFWMLETIREFARERLSEARDAVEIRKRHERYFLRFAELAEPGLWAWSPLWFERLEAEHDNIRAALRDAIDHRRAGVALRLGGAVWLFWFTRGYSREGRRWLDEALSLSMGDDPHLRVNPLWGAGLLAVWQGDAERGREAANELLAIAAKTGSNRARANGFMLAAIAASRRRDWDEAATLHTEWAQLAHELGDSWMLGMSSLWLGDVALNRGEYERAEVLFKEGLAIGRERNDGDLCARALLNLGFATLMLGDPYAHSLLCDGLTAARQLELTDGFIYGFIGLAAAYAREDPDRAARLIGLADLLAAEAASDLQPFEARIRNETEAELQIRLGEADYTAGYTEGRALPLEEALTLALEPIK